MYSIGRILKIDKSNIDKIINSKISKQVVAKLAMNIISSIKNKKNYTMFNSHDYDYIVDNNIDDVLDEIGISSLKKKKNVISIILKEIGLKATRDIPDTEKITSKIPSYLSNILYIVTNDSIKGILIIVDIFLIVVLIILNLNINLLNIISKILLLCIPLLFITNIIIYSCSLSYTNEWNLVNVILRDYNYSIINCEIIIILISTILYTIYKLVKKIYS